MMNEQKLTIKPQKMKCKKNRELIILKSVQTLFPDCLCKNQVFEKWSQ